MIIVLKPEAPPETASELLDRIAAKGLKPLHMPGTERVVLGALGDERVLAELALESHPWPMTAPVRSPAWTVRSWSPATTPSARRARPPDSGFTLG